MGEVNVCNFPAIYAIFRSSCNIPQYSAVFPHFPAFFPQFSPFPQFLRMNLKCKANWVPAISWTFQKGTAFFVANLPKLQKACFFGPFCWKKMCVWIMAQTSHLCCKWPNLWKFPQNPSGTTSQNRNLFILSCNFPKKLPKASEYRSLHGQATFFIKKTRPEPNKKEGQGVFPRPPFPLIPSSTSINKYH